MSKIIESNGLALPSCLLQLGMVDRAAIKAFRVEEKAASRVLPRPDQEQDRTGIPKVCYSVSARRISAVGKLRLLSVNCTARKFSFPLVARLFRIKIIRRVDVEIII